MLTKQSREDLKWAMKASLLEQTSQIKEKEARQFVKEFVLNEATYEQLLNLTYNPYRDDVYLEYEKLETVAKTFIEESLAGETGKKAISLLESFVKEAQDIDPDIDVNQSNIQFPNPAKQKKSSAEFMKTRQGEPSLARRGLEAVKSAGSAAYKNVGQHKLGYGLGAAGAAAAGIGGYLIYRKMRAVGKDKRQAALAAANASKDSAEQQKWLSKAQIA